MIYFDTKILILILAILVFSLLLLHYRSKALIPTLLSFVIALLWSYSFRYEYNGNNILLGNRINVYPLLLWTIGLAGVYLISLKLPSRYRITLAITFYLATLIVVEAIGYHLLNIRLNSQYESLLNLGVIHAPTTVKLFYIFIGPAFILILDWINTNVPLPPALRITK